MPKRIQRKREYGWRAGSAVVVDRSSRYGNPWRIYDDTLVIGPDDTMQRFATPAEARQAATQHFRAWLLGEGVDNWQTGRKVFSRRRILTDLWRLKDRDLACMCPLPKEGEPDHCHAVVLMEFAAHPERLAR
jgi:ribosomal protein L34